MRTKASGLRSDSKDVELRGRIMGKREMSNLTFLDLRDDTGKAQICLQKGTLGDSYSGDALKYGDQVRVTGDGFKTNGGTRTLNVKEYEVYSRPSELFPDRRAGLSRRNAYENRGLDILTNDETFARFQKINKMVGGIRTYLYNKGYQETETGILQKSEDNSPSRAFLTYCNALGYNLTLRKSKEQKMKQLIVGGFEKIFEIGKSFRNGQITRKYHPEINGLELYCAYSDWNDILGLTTDILKNLNRQFGTPTSNPQQTESVDFYNLLEDSFNIDGRDATLRQIKKLIPEKRLREYQENDTGRAFALMDLAGFGLEEYDETNVVLMGVPKQISVLSKTSEEEPSLAEEFRYYVKGTTFCYGNTELTDAVEQEKRLIEQSEYEGKSIDLKRDPFLKLMRLGMPPLGGLGVGLDRLLSIYAETDSIKDVIYFPL